MGASRQYTAIFAIGGKLLGSFSGVMGTAQARMARLRASGMAMMAGLRRAAMLASGAIGLIFGSGLLAGGMMLKRIFQNAGSEMQEAQDRARKLTAFFMRNREIQKQGVGRAQELVGIFSEQTEQLYKQGILSQDMLDNMVVGMAQAKIPPAAIKDALEPMADMLAAVKGVRATEEDATALAFAWGKAINTGMIRPLQKFGVFLGPDQQKAFRELVKAGKYKDAHKYLLGIAKQFKGWNKKTLEAPGAAVVKLNQELDEMSERIGAHILPLQDRMARAWLKALPKIEPVIIWTIKQLGKAVEWTAKQIEDLVNVLTTAEAIKVWKDLADSIRSVAEAMNLLPKPTPPADLGARFLKGVPGFEQVTPGTIPPMLAGPQPPPKGIGQLIGEFLTQKAGPEAAKMFQSDAQLIAGVRKEYEKFRTEMDAVNAQAVELWNQLSTKPVIGPVLNEIKAFGEFAQLALVDPASAIKIAWRDLFGDISTGIQSVNWAGLWGNMKSQFQTDWAGIVGFFTEWIPSKWQEATSRLTGDWATATAGVKEQWQAVCDFFSTSKDWIIETFEAIGKAIGEFLMWPIRKVEEAWRKLTGAITGFSWPSWLGGKGGDWSSGVGHFGNIPAASPEDIAATTATAPMVKELSKIREQFAAELVDPETKRLLMASTGAEVGTQGAASQLGYIESVMNRAAAEGKSLRAKLLDPNYYPASTKSQLGAQVTGAAAEGYSKLIDQAIAGSNIAKFATGNESGGVRSGGAQIMFNPGRGERFVAENWTRDWIEGMKAATAASTTTPSSFAPPPLLAAQPSFQAGGIVRRLTSAMLGERGPEAVIPLTGGRRALSLLNYAARSLGVMGGGQTQVSFAPVITINGNATEAEQRAMDSRLRDLARDFIDQFKSAQYQERRLSYEGGYG